MSLIVIQKIGLPDLFNRFVTPDLTRKKINICEYKGKMIKVKKIAEIYSIQRERINLCLLWIDCE